MAILNEGGEGDYVLRLISTRTWMATAPCLDDSRMSPVGYGKTEQDAIRDLTSQPLFQAFLKRSGRRQPSLAQFTIDQQAIRTDEDRGRPRERDTRATNREPSDTGVH